MEACECECSIRAAASWRSELGPAAGFQGLLAEWSSRSRSLAGGNGYKSGRSGIGFSDPLPATPAHNRLLRLQQAPQHPDREGIYTMVFLEMIDYGGCTWTASLRSVQGCELQLVFRAHSPESPIGACICPLPPRAATAVQEAGVERLVVLREILAEELAGPDRSRWEDEDAAYV